MKNKLAFIPAALFVASSLLLFSCASSSSTKRSEAYPAFYGETPPVSILVMPPINLTNNVDAKDYFYYTLQAVLANRGYYSFPPLLSMQTLQENSAYDSELFLEGNISKFGQLFGADLLLFTKITEWGKHPVGGHVDVGIEYIFRSTSTGETVYTRKGTVDCDTSFKSGFSGGGFLALIGMAVDAIGTAAKTAATDYTAVAGVCNYATIGNDLPAGKYAPTFRTDGEDVPGVASFKITASVGNYNDQFYYSPLAAEEQKDSQTQNANAKK